MHGFSYQTSSSNRLFLNNQTKKNFTKQLAHDDARIGLLDARLGSPKETDGDDIYDQDNHSLFSLASVIEE